MSDWTFDNENPRAEMEEEITAANCGKKLSLIRHVSGISRRELAKILGCSESTISRLESGIHQPTIEFMNKLRALQIIGYHRFKKLNSTDRSALAETMVAAGSGAGGVVASIGAIGATGTVAGFSAAGITSGLAALGGSLLGGVAVVAVLPVAVGAAGYGVVKGIKAICENNNLSCKEVDGRFEIVPEPLNPL